MAFSRVFNFVLAFGTTNLLNLSVTPSCNDYYKQGVTEITLNFNVNTKLNMFWMCYVTNLSMFPCKGFLTSIVASQAESLLPWKSKVLKYNLLIWEFQIKYPLIYCTVDMVVFILHSPLSPWLHPHTFPLKPSRPPTLHSYFFEGLWLSLWSSVKSGCWVSGFI